MIKSALNSYAATTERSWASDRSQTVGASDVGQCARKVFWSKNEGDPQYGAQRDPDYVDGWGAKVRGSFYENHFWVPAMRAAYGERLLFAGTEQKTFVSGFLSATPDGLLIGLQPDEVAPGSGTEVCTECKTVDPRTNLTEAKVENVFQTHIQMGLIRELTPYKPTHSILSYTDASFWSEIKEFVIPFDEKVYEGGKARAAQIMTATSAAELKPEGWIAGGKDCEYCPFTKACGITRRSVPETDAKPDPQFVAECADLAVAIKALEGRRDDADEQMRELQQQMRDRLREHGVRKIPGVVSWSSVKGRQSYNNKAIQQAAIAAGVDIEQFSTVGEPTDRLTIQLKDAAADVAA